MISSNEFIISKYQLVVLDLDGVVYNDQDLIPGAAEAIAAIRSRGIRVVFNTNNSARTRETYVERLTAMGITSDVGEIFTSGYIACAGPYRTYARGAKAFVVGEIGLVTELEQAGFLTTQDPEDIADVQFVISGWDRQFTYDRLKGAIDAQSSKARNILPPTRTPQFPCRGCLGRAGTIVAAISTAIRRTRHGYLENRRRMVSPHSRPVWCASRGNPYSGGPVRYRHCRGECRRY